MWCAIAFGVVLAGLSLWIRLGLPVDALGMLSAFLGAGGAGFFAESWWDSRHTAEVRLWLQLRRGRRRARFWRRQRRALAGLTAMPAIRYGAGVAFAVVIAWASWPISGGVFLIIWMLAVVVGRSSDRFLKWTQGIASSAGAAAD